MGLWATRIKEGTLILKLDSLEDYTRGLAQRLYFPLYRMQKEPKYQRCRDMIYKEIPVDAESWSAQSKSRPCEAETKVNG